MSESYTSGNWHVKAGKEKTFIETWGDFLQWTRKDHPGMVRAQLIRDEKDPKHFVSFAEWTDDAARAAWRASPEFTSMLGKTRELCDDFEGLDYKVVTTI